MNLRKKLHPSRFTNMSGRMTAIVEWLINDGQRIWTDPSINELNITSDDHVIVDGAYFSTYTDLKQNIDRLVDCVEKELTPAELKHIYFRLASART